MILMNYRHQRVPHTRSNINFVFLGNNYHLLNMHKFALITAVYYIFSLNLWNLFIHKAQTGGIV